VPISMIEVKSGIQ